MTKNLRAAIGKLVKLEEECHNYPSASDDPALGEAMDAVEAAVKADTAGAWEIIRYGSEREFSSLVNLVGEIGGEFDMDDACREIMTIAKQRLEHAQDYDDLMLSVKSCFGSFFDKYWNETEPVVTAAIFEPAAAG